MYNKNNSYHSLWKLALLALILITVGAPSAWATGGMAANFLEAYPSADGTRLDSCGACHFDFGYVSGMGENLNPYGDAMAANGTSAAAILAIGSDDSDGDGFSNDDEITGTGFTNIPTFPGLTSSNVSQVTGVDPSELTGFLVPVADAECASDDDCADDLFCNGDETCVDGACVIGTDPCEASQTCDDDIDECVFDEECAIDEDCADDLFCNGDETCVEGECVVGTDACAVDDICLEDSEECVECEEDSDCAEGETCEDDMCVDSTDCPEIEDIDLDGNCLLSKEELKAVSNAQKIRHKAEKTDLKVEQKVDKDHLKYLKAEYSE